MICLIAYLTVTFLFIAGLAFAAGRPTPVVPAVQMSRQDFSESAAETVPFREAA
ncbi:MAG: hypothetical protein L0Z50_15540 [Verrucomicrobiales bacterium]|nr:hypothetical protein [Verrucomicrobiales bacterium]